MEGNISALRPPGRLEVPLAGRERGRQCFGLPQHGAFTEGWHTGTSWELLVRTQKPPSGFSVGGFRCLL